MKYSFLIAIISLYNISQLLSIELIPLKTDIDRVEKIYEIDN